jgi:hypothetical protein
MCFGALSPGGLPPTNGKRYTPPSLSMASLHDARSTLENSLNRGRGEECWGTTRPVLKDGEHSPPEHCRPM